MRTTVTLDDGLLARVRERAAAQRRSVSDIIDDALRRAFADEQEPTAPAPEIVVFTEGDGPAPGVDLSSNMALAELLDEDTPLDQRR